MVCGDPKLLIVSSEAPLGARACNHSRLVISYNLDRHYLLFFWTGSTLPNPSRERLLIPIFVLKLISLIKKVTTNQEI